jgi:hypothetical protein
MRQGSNPKRSRGRGSPRKTGSTRNQPVESNGPDVRIRGTLSQVLEKYLALARDAAAAGDYISAENYYQHAEHYFRVRNGNGGGAFQGGAKAAQPAQPRGNGANGRPESAAEGGNGGEPALPDQDTQSASPEAEPTTPNIDSDPETR